MVEPDATDHSLHHVSDEHRGTVTLFSHHPALYFLFLSSNLSGPNRVWTSDWTVVYPMHTVILY